MFPHTSVSTTLLQTHWIRGLGQFILGIQQSWTYLECAALLSVCVSGMKFPEVSFQLISCGDGCRASITEQS